MNWSKVSALILLLAGALSSFSQEIVINEFQASNASTVSDPDFGSYSDWIELYNPSDQAVDLGFWYLTDLLEDTVNWQFPEGVSLDPGGYLVIWADGKDLIQSDLHAGFRLSIAGEEIGLYSSSKILVDSVVYGKQMEDISSGRQPDGAAEWHFFDSPTPGTSNSTAPYLKAKVPAFSMQSGFYTEDQLLEINSVESGVTIRYTLNGDEPLATSPVEIRTNEDPLPWLPDWVPPAGEVFKANVVRARAFRAGYEPSDVITLSCFIDADIYQRYATLPVISITSDSKHLFDHQTGIYVPGATHVDGEPESGNYFQDWEKPAHIAYFEPGGQLGFAQDVGIRIQGGTSPNSPQKGLHVIARSAYGKNRISYPVFQDDPSKAKQLTEFKRFIIRAWGSLIAGALFNDAYAHRLMANSDLDIQAYQPVVVFINGEYWGLHALREANKNPWYYQYHYGIDRDDPGVDILQHTENNGQPYAVVDEGSADHWNSMMNFLRTNDMLEPGNYAYLKTQMDMDNFIAYMWHCIYVGKWDWPNNNDASWRPGTATGKWKWIQFDMETGFGVATSLGPQYAGLGPQFNMLQAVVEPVNIPDFGTYGPHPIMTEIYDNEEFMSDFVAWFTEHRNHEFHPDTMNALLDDMAAEIRPYMPEYKHRWPFIGNILEEWETALQLMKDYNLARPAYVEQHLWALSSTEKYTPQEYKLDQNSPNPFSNSTLIKYQLPEAASVQLKIFNASGQLIDSFSQQHHAAGQYVLEWDASFLSPGVYFVSMKADNFFEVKKLLKIAGE
jgi:hypothetical protein